jgi:hypothetical protein
VLNNAVIAFERQDQEQPKFGSFINNEAKRSKLSPLLMCGRPDATSTPEQQYSIRNSTSHAKSRGEDESLHQLASQLSKVKNESPEKSVSWLARHVSQY